MKIQEFKLERFFARYEHKVPYLLCASDPESFSIEELLNFEPKSKESFLKSWLGYTETQGGPRLREEIKKLYTHISDEEILVTAGAEEAIFLFMNAVLDKADHVIIHFPNYQSLEEVARSCSAEITRWTANEEDSWELDIDFLKKNIRENTKAIIINCPHNPTGYLMSKEKLLEVVNIAKKHSILIFSDEVYRYLEFNESDRLPAICDIYENGVSVSVMTKAFALPGLRIGWAATKRKDILSEMAKLKDYTTICCSAPSEFLAIIGLRNKEKILKRNLEILSSNLKILDNFFTKYRDMFSWVMPKAGTIAFPNIKLEIDIDKLCHDLIEKKGVALLPGTVYSYGNKNFRIGFGRKNMKECIEKLEEYLVRNFKPIGVK